MLFKFQYKNNEHLFECHISSRIITDLKGTNTTLLNLNSYLFIKKKSGSLKPKLNTAIIRT